MIFEGDCAICGKHFRRRYAITQNAPICCSVKCGSIRLKKKWQDPRYRQHMSDAHKGNPGYWTGKERLDMRGANNPKWKGGNHKWVDDQGYARVGIPKYLGQGKYIKEHRLVMEKHLGRKLTKEEIVHHINEDKSDNRIENLMLFKNNGEHLTHHKKLRPPKPNNRMCKWCKKEFYTKRLQQKCCSISCGLKYYNKLKGEQNANTPKPI